MGTEDIEDGVVVGELEGIELLYRSNCMYVGYTGIRRYDEPCFYLEKSIDRVRGLSI